MPPGKRAAGKTRSAQSPPEVVKLTRRISILFRDRLEEQLRSANVTAAQLQLLAALTREPLSSGAQIARYCQVTPQTTHTLMAVAERRGWITRVPDPQNEHTLLATLTPEGRRVFRRSKAVALRLQEKMLSSFSAADIAQLQSMLTELLANLESATPPPNRRRAEGDQPRIY